MILNDSSIVISEFGYKLDFEAQSGGTFIPELIAIKISQIYNTCGTTSKTPETYSIEIIVVN